MKRALIHAIIVGLIVTGISSIWLYPAVNHNLNRTVVDVCFFSTVLILIVIWAFLILPRYLRYIRKRKYIREHMAIIKELNSKVFPPFTPDEVEYFNQYQKLGFVHEYTCGSPDAIKECQRRQGINGGELTATEHSLSCPCKKYVQNWFHKPKRTIEELKKDWQEWRDNIGG